MSDVATPTLRTERLILRPWRRQDAAPFAALNADPRVVRYFPAPYDRAQSDALIDRIRTDSAAAGFGLWAAEVLGVSAFIGFVGLARPGFDAPFMPAVEVGWRLARPFWGRGYATEGALAVLSHAFDAACLDEVVSMTSRINAPSRRVMAKVGMTHDADDDFDHPRIAAGDPLRAHVLYRRSRAS